MKERKDTFKNSTFLVIDFVRINDQKLIQIDDITNNKTESADLMKNKYKHLMYMIFDLKQILYSLSSTSRKNNMIKQMSINNERDNKSKSLIEIKISLISVSTSDSLNHEITDSSNDQVKQQQQLSFEIKVITDSIQEAVFTVSFLMSLSDNN